MNRSSLNCAASAAVLFLLAGSAFGQIGGTPVAVSGMGTDNALSAGSTNGTAGLSFTGTSFSAVGRLSVINGNGDVVMLGAFAGGNGVWRNMAGSNANANLARGGTALPAPATPAGNYNNSLTWASPFVDSGGNAMFYNAIAGTTGPLGSTTDTGIFRVSTTGAANFATRGSNLGNPLPNSTGRDLPSDFSNSPVVFPQGNTNQSMALMNNNGAMLMTGGSSLNSVVQISGMWTGSATASNYDTLTPVMLRVLSTYSFSTFSGVQGDFVGGTPSFNDNGRAAYNVDFISGTGTSTGAARTSNQNRGLVTNRNGSEELLMMRSTDAPWLPSGVLVGAIGSISPSMNNANQISLAFPITGTGITQANDNIIARFNANGTVSTFQEGSNSGRQTGGGNNILLGGQLNTSSNISGAIISANGTVFATSIGNVDSLGNVLPAGGGNAALFRWSPESGTRVIALTGDTAPNTGGGLFNSFSVNRAVNGNDQIAFLTNLVTTAGNPGGVTSSNDQCLYATDVAGNLILVAREGFALPGDPVGGRTVTSIIFGAGINNNATNGQDGRGVFFNDAGQLVYNIGFSDGNSGVFITNVAPTPGAAAVLGLGALAGLRRRRA